MKIPYSLKIHPALLERAKRLAELEHRTTTALIEWAIDAYCERRERQLKILQDRK